MTETHDFAEEYGRRRSDAAREAEYAALGSDIGLNGYTTAPQAQLLTEQLNLKPESVLLDIGAGRGWPGFHLASTTGCRLVSTDIPHAALREGQATFDARGIGGHCKTLAADGRWLPFRSHKIDAVTHADVFC